jgi:hypothetical protein
MGDLARQRHAGTIEEQIERLYADELKKAHAVVTVLGGVADVNVKSPMLIVQIDYDNAENMEAGEIMDREDLENAGVVQILTGGHEYKETKRTINLTDEEAKFLRVLLAGEINDPLHVSGPSTRLGYVSGTYRRYVKSLKSIQKKVRP